MGKREVRRDGMGGDIDGMIKKKMKEKKEVRE